MTADLNNISSVNLKWDPKNLEIRTRTVEKTLEPLVIQVSGLLLIYFKHVFFFKTEIDLVFLIFLTV